MKTTEKGKKQILYYFLLFLCAFTYIVTFINIIQAYINDEKINLSTLIICTISGILTIIFKEKYQQYNN